MKKDKKAEAISTFLGPEAGIEGAIAFEGSIRLDGKVSGDITSENGTVIVGETGQVEAVIKVDTAIVKGVVTGTIHARDRIELHPPARVTGDIAAPVITIAAGVVFNGKCTMTLAAAKVGEKATAKGDGNSKTGEERKEGM
jgi:cytoskeletal protein CcmA (bactofilin family)